MPRQPCKCTTNMVLAFFAALVVIAIAGVAIAGIVTPHSREPIQRYCFNKDNGQLLGTVAVDSVDNVISWDFQYTPTGSFGGEAVLALQIVGPAPVGEEDPFTGPLHVALCGIPSMMACDISTENTVKGTLTMTNPAGLALKTFIQSIRDSPWLYALRINVSGPSGLGAFQQHFTSVCGSK